MTLLGICESILTKMSSFQTAIKEYLVFLLGLLEQSSKITLAPGIKSSLHLPVFLTWTFSSLSFIRTWAINLLGLLTKIPRSEEHTSELQSRGHLVCRLLLETKN